MGVLDTLVAGGGIGAAAGMASSQMGESNSDSVSDSWGSSGSQAYNYSDATSDAWSNAWSWANGDSEGWSNAKNSGITYGREATAKDIELAAEQNALQRSLWRESADYNAKQAQLDRDFQAYMSNTAYQRAVKDLLAAGLNPILAVGNMGASTPVGAMGQMSSASAYRANVQAQHEEYGSSASGSWSRSRSKSGSQSESHSKSHSEGGSSSWSSEGSHSESHSNSNWKPAYIEGAKEVGKIAQNAIDEVGKMANTAGNTAKQVAKDREKTGYDDHMGRAVKENMRKKGAHK